MARLGMKLFVAVAVIGCGMGASASGEDAAPASAPATAPKTVAPPAPMRRENGPFSQEMVQMNSANLKLTVEQRAKLKDQMDAMAKELEEFRVAADAKSKSGIQSLTALAGAANVAERDKLRKTLMDEDAKATSDYAVLLAKHQTLINATLTADQRVLWETAKLNRYLSGLSRSAPELTEAQKKLVKPMIEATAKELADLKDAGGAAAITGKLMKKLVTEVFTEEQSGAMFMVGYPTLTGLGVIPGSRNAPVDRDLP